MTNAEALAERALRVAAAIRAGMHSSAQGYLTWAPQANLGIIRLLEELADELKPPPGVEA